MKQLVISMALLFSFATNGFGQEIQRLTIKEECVPCRRMIPQTCLLVKKGSAKEYELFYERISGFEFVPGHQYVIDVKVTERNPAPQDLSKYIYSLEKVISDVPVISGSKQVIYQVERLNGKDISHIDVHFAFDSTLTRMYGKSACNQFNTQVKFNTKKTKMQTKIGVSTLMACIGDEIAQVETAFLKAISDKKFKVKKSENKLVFSSKGKEVLVVNAISSGLDVTERLEDIIQGGRPEKTAWNFFNQQNLKLIQLDGQAVENSNAQIKFDMETGSFTGSNGCNRISGKMIGKRNEVFFADIISTKMYCADENGKIERRFMEIVSSKGLTVDFAETVLNIYDADGNLVMMFSVLKDK